MLTEVIKHLIDLRESSFQMNAKSAEFVADSFQK